MLRMALLRRDPVERYNFPLLRSLFKSLESKPGFTPRPVDLFRHAVLCYQTGEYAEGAERFRRLREQMRRSGIVPPRARELWRVNDDPTEIRVTRLRVTRITSEWRADGYIEDLRQYVPLRPRHFTPLPKENEVISCVIRFELNGPLAVPPRFEDVGAARTRS